MTPRLPTPTSLPTPLAPDTKAPDTKAPAAKKPETDWEREVWKWVEPEFDELKKKMPLLKAEGACGVICHPSTDAHMKEFTRCLTEHGEPPPLKAPPRVGPSSAASALSAMKAMKGLGCLPLCPRHYRAGREAGPHPMGDKPFHCGCCAGTCERCLGWREEVAAGVCRPAG